MATIKSHVRLTLLLTKADFDLQKRNQIQINSNIKITVLPPNLFSIRIVP